VCKRLRSRQICPNCNEYCQQFYNLRFVDCYFEIAAESNTGREFRKRGCTPRDSGKVVSYFFENVEDIKAWAFISVLTYSNEKAIQWFDPPAYLFEQLADTPPEEEPAREQGLEVVLENVDAPEEEEKAEEVMKPEQEEE